MACKVKTHCEACGQSWKDHDNIEIVCGRLQRIEVALSFIRNIYSCNEYTKIHKLYEDKSYMISLCDRALEHGETETGNPETKVFYELDLDEMEKINTMNEFDFKCPVCNIAWRDHPGMIAMCSELDCLKRNTVKSDKKLHFDWKVTKGGDTSMAKKIVKKSLPKPPAKATKKVVKAKAKPVAKKKK